MLDKLVQTIETLKARIKEHRHLIEAYETRTRVTLIDPMLCALGWIVSDPTLVEVEYKTEGGWADYALLGSNRRPVILIEAKSLAIKKPPKAQTVAYAVNENMGSSVKVNYCAWTNGDEWEVYDISTQDSVMKSSIFEEDAGKCALKFLSLWRRSLFDGSFDVAVEPLVVVEPTPVPMPVVVVPQPYVPTPPLGPGWKPLTANFETTNKPAPKAMRLPDGEERSIAYWVDIIKETALWLHRTRVLTRENCQVAIGPKRYLMSLDNKHQNEQPFSSPIPLGDTGITLEGNFSARDIVRHTKDLLEHFGKDPSQVYLKLE